VVRSATVIFIETLDGGSLDRMGTANGYPLSARLLVNHIYGHHRHHLNIIRERYPVMNGQQSAMGCKLPGINR